jgi:enoyl-CoA hydratase/carnithine racemase
LGLVNWVVPDEELMPKAFDVAHRLANGPEGALAAMKSILYHAIISTFQSSLDLEAEHMVEAETTAEHREAVRAFVEKRRPDFTRLVRTVSEAT